ncbi:SrpA-related protein [hydrothermal vent metagenome]|uniref:SrpA-related protein n=1 Tax=hydrothermal vent metagenome TaxID=652676 RepID=A0A3B1DDM0_9ZZZZ
MEVGITQGPPSIKFVQGKPCKECEAQKDLLEDKLTAPDRVSLSGNSPLEKAIASGFSENGLENNAEDNAPGPANGAGPRSEAELSPEEKQALDDLKARDRDVRAHEQAHLAAAGPYAKGPPSFEFQTGSDGRSYAVGGEVQIDTSKVSGNPQATLIKAQTIKRAANAPSDPSAQDRQVAAQAAQLEAQARQEVKQERLEKQEETSGTEKPDPASSLEFSIPTAGNYQPVAEKPQAGQGRKAPENSNSNLRTQNLLKNFVSPASADKGNLLNIVS